MIRIYFDWNIFSYLRNSKTETFSAIKNYLKENYSSILLVYSPAHLQDLKRSYFNSEKGKSETEKDLDFLGQLTENHCLGYDIKEKTVYPYIKNPREYFKEIFIDDPQENIFDFDSVFDKDDPLGKLWQSYWKLLCSLPTGIDFEELSKMPKDYQSIIDIFKTTKDNNTFGSLMKDIMDLQQHPKELEKMFKEIRRASNKDLKINSDNSKWGDPFEYLNSVLQNNKLQKNFFDLTSEIITNSNKKATRFDYFSNYYIQLDMLGYNKDKKIPNLIDDATHSFYGAHTDIFVTDDNNTNKKSKALYQQLNISTEVIHSDDFFAAMMRHKSSNELRKLPEQVEFSIKNSLLLLDTVDDELNPTRIFKVEPFLFDFFNRFQVSEYENSTALILYKKQGNYSDFMFWIEIKEVINKFCRELGEDSNNRNYFEENDKLEIESDQWKGRVWILQNVDLVLNYLEQPFGLTFKIEYKKPDLQP